METTQLPQSKKSPIISPYRAEKRATELKIYNEFNELMSDPESQVTAVESKLMNKYGIHSHSTIWSIRKRVEKRLSNQNPQ